MSTPPNFETISNPGSFWRAIGVRAIGPAIVTATGASGPAGFLALSTAHLSADPPMMMVSIGLQTSALQTILQARHFALNFLSQDDQDLATEFGGKGQLKGADRFTTRNWTTLVSGAPVLPDAVGAIDCQLEEAIERYGSVIAIGRVLAYTSNSKKRPLVSYSGSYL